jgi:hypothetical protein
VKIWGTLDSGQEAFVAIAGKADENMYPPKRKQNFSRLKSISIDKGLVLVTKAPIPYQGKLPVLVL